jgi:D-xylose reductase
VDAVPSLLTHPTIKSIAQAHSKTPAQVLLRWATQRGIIVIPKSSNPARLAENLNSTDFDLTEEEIASITGLDIRFRFNNPAEIDVRIGIFS